MRGNVCISARKINSHTRYDILYVLNSSRECSSTSQICTFIFTSAGHECLLFFHCLLTLHILQPLKVSELRNLVSFERKKKEKSRLSHTPLCAERFLDALVTFRSRMLTESVTSSETEAYPTPIYSLGAVNNKRVSIYRNYV